MLKLEVKREEQHVGGLILAHENAKTIIHSNSQITSLASLAFYTRMCRDDRISSGEC